MLNLMECSPILNRVDWLVLADGCVHVVNSCTNAGKSEYYILLIGKKSDGYSIVRHYIFFKWMRLDGMGYLQVGQDPVKTWMQGWEGRGSCWQQGCVRCAMWEAWISIKSCLFGKKSCSAPVVREEEVQVENDGSKNPTPKSPQTSVNVAIQKAGLEIR